MLKEIISWQFWKFRNHKDLYGKPFKGDWMAKVGFLIQMLLTFGGRCNRHFWDIRLKILRLPIFNLLFQLVLTKVFRGELFSCLRKVDHVIKSCKEPIGEYASHQGHFNYFATWPVWLQENSFFCCCSGSHADISIIFHAVATWIVPITFSSGARLVSWKIKKQTRCWSLLLW